MNQKNTFINVICRTLVTITGCFVFVVFVRFIQEKRKSCPDGRNVSATQHRRFLLAFLKNSRAENSPRTPNIMYADIFFFCFRLYHYVSFSKELNYFTNLNIFVRIDRCNNFHPSGLSILFFHAMQFLVLKLKSS